MQILRANLIKKGKNEFFNENKYTGNSKQHRFIQKALRFDEDIEKIITEEVFADYRFPTQEVDHFFKKAFTNRFLNREIGRQTIEDFSSQVVFCSIIHEQEIEAIYHNFLSALSNENKSKGLSEHISEHQSISEGSDRSANATLPQDQVNLNLDKHDMAFADDNSISKNNNQSNSNGTDTTNTENSATNYNADTFKKMQGLWNSYFDEYDRKCFLQTW